MKRVNRILLENDEIERKEEEHRSAEEAERMRELLWWDEERQCEELSRFGSLRQHAIA